MRKDRMMDRHDRSTVIDNEAHVEDVEGHGPPSAAVVNISWSEFGDGDTTPDVSGNLYWKTVNTGGTTITNFDNPPASGHQITIIFTDNNTTIQNNANIVLQSGIDFNGADNDVKTFLFDDTNWVEQALDAVHTDGSTILTADWDIGDGRKIQADKIQARDGDGLALWEDGGEGIFINDGGRIDIQPSAPPTGLTLMIGGTSPALAGSNGPVHIFGDNTSGGQLVVQNTLSNKIGSVDYLNDVDIRMRYGVGGSARGGAWEPNWGIVKTSQEGAVAPAGMVIGNEDNSAPIVFIQSDAEIARFIAGGSLGINTTGPDRKLDVLDTATQLRLTYSDGAEFVEFECASNSNLTINCDGNDALILSQAGTLSVDLSGGATAAQVNLHDEHNDPVLIEDFLKGKNLDKAIEIGVISRKKTGSGYMMRLQPMIALLGGGIYQSHHRLDALEDEVAELRAKIA